jgi:hypothetical protein
MVDNAAMRLEILNSRHNGCGVSVLDENHSQTRVNSSLRACHSSLVSA